MRLGKEIEIIQRLVEHLKGYETSILRTADAIAELDWWVFLVSHLALLMFLLASWHWLEQQEILD